MSTRTYQIVFSGPGTTRLPAGVFFLVKSATSALILETTGPTVAPTRFENVGAGLSYGPVPPDRKWKYLDVTSAGAQTVEVIVSEEAEVKVGSVVSVSGSVTTQDLPLSSLNSPAVVNVANGAAGVVPANGARKNLTICNLSTNGGSIFVQGSGAGAGRGIELQPGQSWTDAIAGAVDVRNDSGAAINFTYTEGL